MLLVGWIGDGFEEELEAGDAADILGWCTVGTIEVTGIIRGGIGCGGRLDRDRVPPVVAEAIGVADSVTPRSMRTPSLNVLAK